MSTGTFFCTGCSSKDQRGKIAVKKEIALSFAKREEGKKKNSPNIPSPTRANGKDH